MNEEARVSRATILRLPGYLRFLQQKRKEGVMTITSTIIAQGLNLNSIQVRKDLAIVSSVSGKPKTGFDTELLIADLENFLGYDSASQAVMVGVGGLGKALLSYHGFADYGLEISAAFDLDAKLVGRSVGLLKVRPLEELETFVKDNGVLMGIITVPRAAAQAVCDRLIASGIRAIWNFAPVHLSVPAEVAVRNEDMAASLAVLSKDLARLSDKN